MRSECLKRVITRRPVIRAIITIFAVLFPSGCAPAGIGGRFGRRSQTILSEARRLMLGARSNRMTCRRSVATIGAVAMAVATGPARAASGRRPVGRGRRGYVSRHRRSRPCHPGRRRSPRLRRGHAGVAPADRQSRRRGSAARVRVRRPRGRNRRLRRHAGGCRQLQLLPIDRRPGAGRPGRHDLHFHPRRRRHRSAVVGRRSGHRDPDPRQATRRRSRSKSPPAPSPMRGRCAASWKSAISATARPPRSASPIWRTTTR